jgi:F420-dependent oxidoreductase-like protein
MELGVHVVNFALPGGPAQLGPDLAAIAQAAEGAAFTQLSVMDHFFQLVPLGGPEQPMLEGYTTLGYLAAQTETMRLGLVVSGVTYRYPGLLAKIATTLDLLSGGRAYLGLGAAWYEEEHSALGVPFPPLGERFERLEEAIQICLQMWSDDDGPFQGRHYQLGETRNVPQALQRPHPPLLIGGGGEKKTLRLVAQYADACNLTTAEGLAGFEHKLEVLRAHCDALGRDYDAIQKTVLYVRPIPDAGDQRAFVEELRGYEKAGADMMIVMPGGEKPADQLAGLADTAAALRSG